MSIITLVNPDDKELLKTIKNSRKVIKIIGKMNNWECMKKWNVKYFNDNFGTMKIPVKNLVMNLIDDDDDLNIESWKFSDYLNYYEDKNELPNYYASDLVISNLSNDLFNDYSFELINKIDLLRNCNLENYRWVFIGKKNTYTRLHFDVISTSAWLGVISGKKRFIIFDDIESKVFKGNDKNISLFQLNMDKFMNSLNPIVVDVNPGEIIYVPNNLAHYVINLEDSIAITENFCYDDIKYDVIRGYYNDKKYYNMIYLFVYTQYKILVIFILVLIYILSQKSIF